MSADNGPKVQPPAPGPHPHSLYEYLVIPRQPPVLPNSPFYMAFTAYQQIESEIRMRMAFGDRADRFNGDRLYRVPTRNLWRFDHDNFGCFIGRNPLPVFRFVLDDPSAGENVSWAPI